MENSRFNYIYGSLISNMESETFTQTELLCLSMVYNKFVLQNGPKSRYMTAVQLSKILQIMFKINNKRINDRIVRTVCYDTDCKDLGFSPAQHCTLESFIKLFTIYFSDDLEELMKFTFKVSVYNFNRNGIISNTPPSLSLSPTQPIRYTTRMDLAFYHVRKSCILWMSFLKAMTRTKPSSVAL